MAFTIKPGYDFGTDEVPTEELLRRQASDLEFEGIPVSNLDAAIISMVFGDVSNTSGATPPGEGWIWVDPQGNAFVGGQSRTVRLWQAQGGWESDRLYVVPDGTGHANSTDEGEPVADANPEDLEQRLTSMNTDDLPVAALAQAMESGYTRARILFRGGGQVFVGGQASTANFHSNLIGMRSTANSDLIPSELDSGSYKGYLCYVYDRGDSGAATPKDYAWFPGIHSRGQGTV